MAGYSNYQVKRNKSTRGTNIFEKGNSRRKEKTKSEKLMDGVAEWTSFYRANPHRFVKECLGIELKIFQQIILWAMFHLNYVTYIASRG